MNVFKNNFAPNKSINALLVVLMAVFLFGSFDVTAGGTNGRDRTESATTVKMYAGPQTKEQIIKAALRKLRLSTDFYNMLSRKTSVRKIGRHKYLVILRFTQRFTDQY